MHDSFDVLEYGAFLRARWRFPALACAVALLAAVAISLLLPKRYTAMATILIDPPAGGDPRMATSVSTVYLESLKTYELLAADDQLFVRAVDRFHLRDRDASPVESVKRRVLKVDKPRDTRALEISVTLPDPTAAWEMARFIADGAVELNRSGSRQAGNAITEDAAKAAAESRSRLAAAETAWEKAVSASSLEALRTEISNDGYLKSRAEEQFLDEQTGESESGAPQPPGSAASRARIDVLKRRIDELAQSIDRKGADLARESAREEDLQAALQAARAEDASAAQRLAELRVSLGSRSEWLRVVDPGIIPQRPSSPNAPLIVIGSVLLALFGSWLYLSVAFGLTRESRMYGRPLRVARHGDD